MTFDEIQQILEQMLAVQRELQESQLNQRQEIDWMLAVQRELQESQLNQHQEIVQLLEYQLRQQRLVDRLIGYSITNESDHLNLEERMNALERRMGRLDASDN